MIYARQAALFFPDRQPDDFPPILDIIKSTEGIILDLNPEGKSLQQSVYKLISKTQDHTKSVSAATRLIHSALVFEIVRLLNLEPTLALTRMTKAPRLDELKDTYLMIPLHEVDSLVNLYTYHAQRLYQLLRRQLTIDLNTLYKPISSGLDYVVVQYVHLCPSKF